MNFTLITYVAGLVARLRDEEDGLALTEYLLLLGLLTAAVVGSVLLFGETLGFQWSLWATWLNDLNGPPPLT